MFEVLKDWGLISQWFGLGLIGIAAAVFIIIDFPLLRHYAIAAIVFFITAGAIYSKGIHDHAVLAKAQRELAEKRAIERGDSAHSNAVNDLARGVRDGFDRDQQ